MSSVHVFGKWPIGIHIKNRSTHQVESQGGVVRLVGVKGSPHVKTADVSDDDTLLHGRPFAIVQAKFHQQFGADGKGAGHVHFQFQAGGGEIHHLGQTGVLGPVFSQKGESSWQVGTFTVLLALFQSTAEMMAAGTGAVDRNFLVRRGILAYIHGFGMTALGTSEGGGVVLGYENGLIHKVTILFEAAPLHPSAAIGAP